MCGQMLEDAEQREEIAERREQGSGGVTYGVIWGLLQARLRAVVETRGFRLCGKHAGD